MCRITGIISQSLPAGELQAKAKLMCDVLSHGGPDDEGMYCQEDMHLAFGHRRLSIIDLSKNGHQPMTDTAQKVVITFNGEIYNYLALKQELLLLGATFFSDTDTEVILQAYLFWGPTAFGRLMGMFAFALLDKSNDAVYLVRDTMGIKPLYYFNINGTLIFASEIRAFKAIGIYKHDQRWPVFLLAYGSIPEPYTTLKDVQSLPKGHYLVRSKNGSCRVIKYGQYLIGNNITNLNEVTQGLREHLQRAVKRQLIADAPIGVFLSGGIDSSLITLLANKEHAEQLKTISIFFDDKQYDESAYQNDVSALTSGENFRHLVKQQHFEEYFPEIFKAMDMPTTDGINSWFISKYAHNAGLKAVLSGLGADELFGGYPSFQRIQQLKYLRKFPASFFKLANLLKDKYRKLAYLAYDHPAADYLFLRGAFTPMAIAEILNMDESQVINILFSGNKFPVKCDFTTTHAAWLESNVYMQNQLLRDTDVMSMAHGLEVRVPFLDEDLQRYAGKISPALRFNLKQPKKVLTDSFKDILPETVWNRPKMGFTFPLQQWMKDNKSINNPLAYKGKMAQGIVKKFNSGSIHWSRVYALYQIQGHA